MARQVFVGPLIHTNEKEKLIIKDRVAVYIDGGKITNVDETLPINHDNTNDFGVGDFCDKKDITVLSSGQFMTPGFIDCHTHANQFPNLGLGYNKSLLNWLDDCTYPLERLYKDKQFAAQVFEAVVKRTIEMGTTTACYFASLYAEASVILAEKTANLGQRAFIGKVNMNVWRKDEYFEKTGKSIENTRAFIKSIDHMKPLVKPIITPRFALSCDMDLMRQLANIAKENDLHIQTHVSENKNEITKVEQTYPDYTYATVYDSAGLLTSKTILAHGIYLKNSELTLLKERGTAVIHCPSSNTNLKSGLCDVQRLKSSGIKVGLGTDVSGGASYSMLDEMRSALQVSNCLSLTRDNYTPLSYKDVFHMATLGGAKALSIDDKVGNLSKGKQFDALIIDMGAKNSLLDNFKEYTPEENFQRFIYAGDDRNIVSVYVNGKKVK